MKEAGRRSFAGLGAIYAAGQFTLQALAFLLLPIYTRFLSVADIGRFAVTGTISDISGFLMVAGVYSGYNRFYLETPPKLRSRLRNTALTFSLLAGAASCGLLMLAQAPLAALTPGVDNFGAVLFWMLLNNLILQVTIVFRCDYLLEYKAVKSVAVNVFKAAVTIPLTLYFLGTAGEGLTGIYKAQAIAGALQLAYFLIENADTLRFEADRKMLAQMLKFGAGLIPSNISASLLNFSDRFFMAGYRSLTETAVYSIGYKFGMQIDPLFTTPFRQVFTSYKYETWHKAEASRKFNDMFLKYHVAGSLAFLCIAVASRLAIRVFTTGEYVSAYRIVPIVLVAYFLFGKSRFYNIGIELKNKTYLDSAVLIAGGAVNIALNFLFIPAMGMTGAALATAISYALINVLYGRVSGKLYRVSYDKRRAYGACAAAAVLYCLYYIFAAFVADPVYDIIPGLLLPAAYIAICVKSKMISREDIKGLLRRKTQEA